MIFIGHFGMMTDCSCRRAVPRRTDRGSPEQFRAATSAVVRQKDVVRVERYVNHHVRHLGRDMTLGIERLSRTAVGVVLLFLAGSGVANAQPMMALDSGESVYHAACTACHGSDGRGAPQLTVAFDLPLPDFTDCSFSSREPAADWFAISHDGGPARGFDRRMPAFSQALNAGQIEMAVALSSGSATTRPGRRASSTCRVPSSPRRRSPKTKRCCRRPSPRGPSSTSSSTSAASGRRRSTR